MDIRIADRSDIPGITNLIDASIRGIGGQFYRSDQVDSSLVYLFGVDTRMIDDGGYFVVTSDNQIVGAGGWSHRRTPFGGDQAADVRDAGDRDPSKDPAVIRAFYVHPDYARRGIGRMLIEASEAAAREEGFNRFELMAILSGIDFYERVGYKKMEPVEIPLEDGVVIEAVRMVKD